VLKKTFIAVALGFAGLIALLCIVVALQPSEYSIERSTSIAAPPSEVFPHINDLRLWDAWSAWKELDPNPQTTISDPSSGEGARFTWSGNDAIGEGSLTILASRPDERVELEQAFVRPLEGKARMTFTLVPEDGGTRVTWKMDGTNGFVGKAICLVMDLEASVGPSFEQGLANLKAVAEQGGEQSVSADEADSGDEPSADD
jgi:uncharacterized protein YndB with AHSA1/START domain